MSRWAVRAKFILGMYEFSGKDAIMAIFIALKGQAFDYVIDVHKNSHSDNPSLIINQLESRFTIKLFLMQIAERF